MNASVITTSDGPRRGGTGRARCPSTSSRARGTGAGGAGRSRRPPCGGAAASACRAFTSSKGTWTKVGRVSVSTRASALVYANEYRQIPARGGDSQHPAEHTGRGERRDAPRSQPPIERSSTILTYGSPNPLPGVAMHVYTESRRASGVFACGRPRNQGIGRRMTVREERAERAWRPVSPLPPRPKLLRVKGGYAEGTAADLRSHDREKYEQSGAGRRSRQAARFYRPPARDGTRTRPGAPISRARWPAPQRAHGESFLPCENRFRGNGFYVLESRRPPCHIPTMDFLSVWPIVRSTSQFVSPRTPDHHATHTRSSSNRGARTGPSLSETSNSGAPRFLVGASASARSPRRDSGQNQK